MRGFYFFGNDFAYPELTLTMALCGGSGLVPRPEAKHRVSDSPIHRSSPIAVGNYAALFRLPAAALLRVTDKP